jgi:hypothetical protein
MAKIRAKLVPLQVSSDSGTTWKDVVCGINFKHQSSRQSVTVDSYCGTSKEYSDNVEFSFTGTCYFDTGYNTSTQVGYTEMNGWMNAGTKILARLTNGTDGANMHDEGEVLVTDISNYGETGGFMQFDFTLEGSGTKTITGA